MKVLVIDEWIPWPLDSGKKIRTFNLLSRLARKGDIVLVAYATLPEERDKIEIMEKHGIRVVPVRDVRLKKWSLSFYLDVLFNTFSNDPYSTRYHIKPVFIERMLQAVDEHKPDLLHCEWTNLAPFLEYVSDIPKVISAHNVESLIWKRWAEATANPLTKMVAMQQRKRIELMERKWYSEVELTIAVSREESEVIKGYGAKVAVVENGVDMNFYSGYECTPEEGYIVFVASFDTFANQDAVDFLVEQILPLIRISNPNVRMLLVGKSPTARMRDYARKDPRLVVTGSVPDVRLYIAKAALCLVPLRIGGGSRLKILEAMAMRKPVVSTKVGAEGLEARDGKNIIIADGPQKLASEVIRLLETPSERREIGKGGWRLVKGNYDWGPLADKQREMWGSLGKKKGEV